MAVNEDYLTFVQDQLSGTDPFETKKMFGGIGFFRDGIMFGMIGGGVLRLRVNDNTKTKYEAAGMEPLKSKSGKGGMPYFEVPQGILEDQKELANWANEAFQVAVEAKK